MMISIGFSLDFSRSEPTPAKPASAAIEHDFWRFYPVKPWLASALELALEED